MKRSGSTITLLALGAMACFGSTAFAAGWTWKPWYERLALKADFRYRYESIEDTSGGKDREATRQRIRLRFGLYGPVNESVDMGFGLATDKSINSTNHTLETGFGNMTLGMDKAYVSLGWQEKVWKGTLGRMANPFYCPNGEQLVWDGDLTPDGLALGYSKKENPWYGTAAFLLPDSSRTAIDGGAVSSDTLTIGCLQLGYKKEAFNIAASYFDFGGVQWSAEAGTATNALWPVTTAASSTGAASTGTAHTHTYGSATTARRHFHDYNIMELAMEYSFTVSEEGKLKLYGDYLNNGGTADTTGTTLDNPGEDTAWMLGVEYKVETWKLGLNYRVVEQNAMVASYNDSDFGGGGTDAEGYKIYYGYTFKKNCDFGLTYLLNEENIRSSTNGRVTSSPDYNRLQVDLVFKI